MTSMRYAVFLSVATLGCVQRATLTAPIVLAPSPTETVAETANAVSNSTKRYVIRPHGSSVEVYAFDIATGGHTLVFRDFRGSLAVGDSAATGKLTLNVDLRTLTTRSEMAEGIIKDELLEVYAHPRARLTAALGPGEETDERVVRGNMLLHGVERGISFVGTVRREGEGYRFSTVFHMSRSAFAIKRTPEMDWMIFDDFRVEFDLLATPEVVTVEIMDADSPTP
jgi:polyisoprenoid-binding protein YceI